MAEVRQEIINTFDQLFRAGGGIAITPVSTESRSPSFYGWGVYRVSDKGAFISTDSKAAWYHRGMKVFSAHADKMAGLQQAKDWIRAEYGIEGPWVRNRMRDYVLADINKLYPLGK